MDVSEVCQKLRQRTPLSFQDLGVPYLEEMEEDVLPRAAIKGGPAGRPSRLASRADALKKVPIPAVSP